MIVQIKNGQTILLDNDKLVINGKTYDLPKRIQNRNRHSLTQVDNKIYIDGYEFRNSEFKRSLVAFFYCLF